MHSPEVPAPAAPWRGPVNGAPRLRADAALPPDSDSFLKLAFGLFAVDLFLTVSRLLEIVPIAGGVRIPYLGVTLHVATLALALMSGGAKRVASSRVGVWLGTFTAWMMICTLLSTWKGGSTDTLLRQWLPSLIIFVSCGTVVTLLQFRKIATILAAAIAVIAAASNALGGLKEDRLVLDTGTLGNANELSILLVLGAPFFLVPVFSKTSSGLRKALALSLSAMVIVVIIRSGSRSNFLALVSILIVLFWTRPFAGKLKLGLLAVVLLAVFVAAVPRAVLSRYTTIFGGAESGDEIATSAEESSAVRQHLLQQSLKLTMQHPIFGLGPGTFVVGEADLAKKEGQQATWRVSHNSYTQVSSEMGIPGLLLYLVALWATFRNIFWSRARSHIDPTGRASALSLALLLSLTGLCVNLIFSSNAYFSYLPMLMGLSVVFRKTLELEMVRQSAVVTAPRPRIAVDIKPAPASPRKTSYRFLGRPRRSGT